MNDGDTWPRLRCLQIDEDEPATKGGVVEETGGKRIRSRHAITTERNAVQRVGENEMSLGGS